MSAPGETFEGKTGATVAMVGAGQLARMTHQAAIGLAVTLKVLAVSTDDPAVRAGAPYLIGSPDDYADLAALAQGSDVVTFDHEGVSREHLRRLEAQGVPLAPGPSALAYGQDKLYAREALRPLGFPFPAYAFTSDVAAVDAFAAEHGWPLIAKSPSGGYDGKGVWRLPDLASAEELLHDLPAGLLLEPDVQPVQELAVMVARSAPGQRVAYPVVETVQVDAVCREILAPAPVEPAVLQLASELAVRIAETIEAVGVLAVEFFLTADGLLINELALRPHNSGHYSIEGAQTSQFEQHVRAVLGWPLGITALRAPAVATVNVFGPADASNPVDRLPEALAVPGAHIHLYDKGSRPGRKLGHVTVCGDDLADARKTAHRAVAILEGRSS